MIKTIENLKFERCQHKWLKKYWLQVKRLMGFYILCMYTFYLKFLGWFIYIFFLIVSPSVCSMRPFTRECPLQSVREQLLNYSSCKLSGEDFNVGDLLLTVTFGLPETLSEDCARLSISNTTITVLSMVVMSVCRVNQIYVRIRGKNKLSIRTNNLILILSRFILFNNQ